jgi:hypothetical protein
LTLATHTPSIVTLDALYDQKFVKLVEDNWFEQTSRTNSRQMRYHNAVEYKFAYFFIIAYIYDTSIASFSVMTYIFRLPKSWYSFNACNKLTTQPFLLFLMRTWPIWHHCIWGTNPDSKLHLWNPRQQFSCLLRPPIIKKWLVKNSTDTSWVDIRITYTIYKFLKLCSNWNDHKNPHSCRIQFIFVFK